MIERASLAQRPRSGSLVPGRRGSGIRSRSRRKPATGSRLMPRRPKSERSAGWRVTAARIESSGIRKPPTPIETMNGSGMKRSSDNPIATVTPEKTTARPAVAIVRTTASSFGSPRSSSSR